MTPKEKAEELIDKVSEFSDYEVIDDMRPKKELALIVVNEILLAAEGFDFFPDDPRRLLFMGFWQEVKQEIEKL